MSSPLRRRPAPGQQVDYRNSDANAAALPPTAGILVSSLGIPAVFGVSNAIEKCRTGQQIILDGDNARGVYQAYRPPAGTDETGGG